MSLPFDDHLSRLRTDLAQLDIWRTALIEAISVLERASGTVALHPSPDATPEAPERETPAPKVRLATRKARSRTVPGVTATPGTTTPPSKRPRTPRGPGTAAYTLDQIAQLANEAWERDQPAEAHIVTTLGISASAAKNAMARARQKGILGTRPTGHTDPIERRPFDPDQARLAAAEAL
jgi:hypothetical protein